MAVKVMMTKIITALRATLLEKHVTVVSIALDFRQASHISYSRASASGSSSRTIWVVIVGGRTRHSGGRKKGRVVLRQ